MQGLHLTADLHECACDQRWLTDEFALLTAVRKRVAAVGLRAVAEVSHRFPDTDSGPGGVTATVLLAESHVCVHTWPERAAVTLDVYVCNVTGDHSDKALALMDVMLAFFEPARLERHALPRGRVAVAAALTPPSPALATAMVLAAGRGERMRPLTDTCPKPLLPVRGKSLLGWTLDALTAGGCGAVVVNTGWLGDQIENYFGLQRTTGVRQPLSILYSNESREAGAALETLGGIVRALPLLDPVFWLVAGDVFAPRFVFAERIRSQFAAGDALAHLWLVPNPPHHPEGDFGIDADGRATDPAADHTGDTAAPRLTYSTIGLFRAELFQAPWCHIAPGNPDAIQAPLAPLLRSAIAAGRVTAEIFHGDWTDVGTPERLAAIDI